MKNKLTKTAPLIIVKMTMFLVMSSTFQPVMAQEDQPKKKGELEIGIGLCFLGPAKQMGNLMIEYNYNGTEKNDNIFFGTSYTKYPIYLGISSQKHISYYHYLGLRSQLGIRFNHAYLRRVEGYNSSGLYLGLEFSSYSFVPLYSYNSENIIYVEVGPAFMINKWGNWYEPYSKFSVGLHTGLNIRLWNSRVTYGKIGATYLLAWPNKIGPFNSSTYNNHGEIPESKLSFSYLSLLFAFGVKFESPPKSWRAF
jgi:hypothetical protein